jgi:hypothetical protein
VGLNGFKLLELSRRHYPRLEVTAASEIFLIFKISFRQSMIPTLTMNNFESIADYIFEPSTDAIAQLKQAWAWLVGEQWSPFLYSVLGDVFFEVPAGTVWWLSTATGGLEQVAQSKQHFLELLESESVDEWFLPGLVVYLKSESKNLLPTECYSFHVLPVFEQGSFSAENIFVSEATLHFATSGQTIRQLRGLKDGAPARILIDT